jgi:hypothetical protein
MLAGCSRGLLPLRILKTDVRLMPNLPCHLGRSDACLTEVEHLTCLRPSGRSAATNGDAPGVRLRTK